MKNRHEINVIFLNLSLFAGSLIIVFVPLVVNKVVTHLLFVGAAAFIGSSGRRGGRCSSGSREIIGHVGGRLLYVVLVGVL